MNKTILYLLIIALALQSCATFSKSTKGSLPLTKRNLENLNGIYGITAIDADSVSEYSNRQMWPSFNFLTEIDRKLTKDTLQLDSSSVYKFGLKVINSKKLEISYYKDDELLRKRTLKTKLKKDGYLYLKNKNLGILYFPPIIGSLDLKRTRMTLDNDKNLIFDVAHREYHAVILGFFFKIDTHQYRKRYKIFK